MHRTGLAAAIHTGARKQHTSEDHRFKKRKRFAQQQSTSESNHHNEIMNRIGMSGTQKIQQDSGSVLNQSQRNDESPQQHHFNQTQTTHGRAPGGILHYNPNDSFMRDQSFIESGGSELRFGQGLQLMSENNNNLSELLRQSARVGKKSQESQQKPRRLSGQQRRHEVQSNKEGEPQNELFSDSQNMGGEEDDNSRSELLFSISLKQHQNQFQANHSKFKTQKMDKRKQGGVGGNLINSSPDDESPSETFYQSQNQHQENNKSMMQFRQQKTVKPQALTLRQQQTLNKAVARENSKQNFKKKVTKMVSSNKRVIILKRTVVYLYHGQVKIYGLYSLCIFHGNNSLRKAAVWLVDWKPFDYMILTVIFFNSLSLALYDYEDRDSLTLKNRIIEIVGQAFTVIFAIEAVLEIIARGFLFNRGAYLRDGWCIMDFIVVVTGLTEFFLTSVKLKSLRVLRAMRPLRSITAIPSMKKLVSALLQSLPDFVNVGIFLIFIFALFAILGMHQYSGQFYNACRLSSTPNEDGTWPSDPSIQRVCSKSGYGNFHCPGEEVCGNPDDFGLSVEGEDAILKPWIYYGAHNFDNFGTALQVVFQIVTAESWSSYMYNLMDIDWPVFAAAYTILIVVVGSFFLMNLILAVIIQAFINITKRELDEEVRRLNEQEHSDQALDELLDHIEGEQEAGHGKSLDDEDAEEKEKKKQQALFKRKKTILHKHSQEAQQQEKGQDFPKQTSQWQVKQPSFNYDEEQEKDGGISFLKTRGVQRKVVNIFNSGLGSSSQIFSPDKSQQLGISISQSEIFNTGHFENSSDLPKLSQAVSYQDHLSPHDIPQSSALAQIQQPKAQNQVQSEIPNCNIQLKIPDGMNCDDVSAENDITAANDMSAVDEMLGDDREFMNDNGKKLKLAKGDNYNEVQDPDDDDSQRVAKVDEGLRKKIAMFFQNQFGEDNEEKDKKKDKKSSKSVSFLEQKLSSVNFGSEELLNRSTFAKTVAELTKLGSMEREQKEQNAFKKAFRMYFLKEHEEEQKKNDFFQRLLKASRKSLEQARENMKYQQSLRSVATIRVQIDLRRQANNLSKYFRRFRIEYRADQNPLFGFCYRLQQHFYFQSFITLLIMANSIILAMDRYPQPTAYAQQLEQVNLCFSLLFVVELGVKLLGLGFRGFFYDPYNFLDMVIVLTSIVDIMVSALLSRAPGGVATAMRSFRLLRLFKLAKQWDRLHHLIKTVVRTLKDVSTFSILLFLFMFTFSLLGMELFAFRVRFNPLTLALDLQDGEAPNTNFDSLLNAFTTVFIVLTADGWSAIYFAHYRAVQNATPTVYFIMLIILGQRVLLNLFLAILLQNFDENTLREQLQKELDLSLERKQSGLGKRVKSLKERITKWVKACIARFTKNPQQQSSPFISLQKRGGQCTPYPSAAKGSMIQMSPQKEMVAVANESNMISESIDFSGDSLIQPPMLKLFSSASSPSISQTELQQKKNMTASVRLKIQSEERKKAQLAAQAQEYLMEHPVYGKALWILGKESRVRNFLHRVISNRNFDLFIMGSIVLSAFQLALDSPLQDPNGTFQKTLYFIDMCTTLIFAMESLVKIVAYGLILNGPQSYLKQSRWNILDFVIMILSVVAIAPFTGQFKIFKMFRIVRVLRLIGRNQSLKVGLQALFYALPNIANVTVIMLFFFLIFGILCVSYFKGKLYYCLEDNIPESFINQQGEHLDINNKWECLSAGGEWLRYANTFDNIYQAMLTLFIMATAAAWSDMMFLLTSTTDIDRMPIPMNNIFWIFFCIFFIVVASFFLLNLFVGVVISTFNSEQDRLGGNNLLTDRQKEWIDVRLLVLRASPLLKRKPPKERWRKNFFLISESKYFEGFIFTSIVVNTVVLALKWYQQPLWLNQATEIANYVFTAIFLGEAIVKIIAIGPSAYFKDQWNIFDFIIVVGSLVSLLLYFTFTVSIKGAVTILRAFRILRVIRLIKKAKSLNQIFNTFVVTLPALCNIGGLLLLLLYLYSILGVQLLGEVKRSGMFTDSLNFENFANAFCVLCAIATADSWGTIVAAALKQHRVDFQCKENPTYEDYQVNDNSTVGCGPGVSGVLYFWSFYIFVNLIFLNLFIAIVLTGFQETQIKDQRLFNNDMVSWFRQVWADFDPEATAFIPISQLRNFLIRLGEPLGFTEQHLQNKYQQDKFIASLQLPTYDNFSQYQFLDVLDALSLRLMVIDHTKQYKLNRQRTQNANEYSSCSDEEDDQNEGEDVKDTEEQEEEVKEIIQKDINKLLFKKEAEEITAVKEVLQRERSSKGLEAKRDEMLTSMHQAAAEVAVMRMRKFVEAKKQAREEMLAQHIIPPEKQSHGDNTTKSANLITLRSCQLTSQKTSSQQLVTPKSQNTSNNRLLESPPSPPPLLPQLGMQAHLAIIEDEEENNETPLNTRNHVLTNRRYIPSRFNQENSNSIQIEEERKTLDQYANDIDNHSDVRSFKSNEEEAKQLKITDIDDNLPQEEGLNFGTPPRIDSNAIQLRSNNFLFGDSNLEHNLTFFNSSPDNKLDMVTFFKQRSSKKQTLTDPLQTSPVINLSLPMEEQKLADRLISSMHESESLNHHNENEHQPNDRNIFNIVEHGPESMNEIVEVNEGPEQRLQRNDSMKQLLEETSLVNKGRYIWSNESSMVPQNANIFEFKEEHNPSNVHEQQRNFVLKLKSVDTSSLENDEVYKDPSSAAISNNINNIRANAHINQQRKRRSKRGRVDFSLDTDPAHYQEQPSSYSDTLDLDFDKVENKQYQQAAVLIGLQSESNNDAIIRKKGRKVKKSKKTDKNKLQVKSRLSQKFVLVEKTSNDINEGQEILKHIDEKAKNSLNKDEACKTDAVQQIEQSSKLMDEGIQTSLVINKDDYSSPEYYKEQPQHLDPHNIGKLQQQERIIDPSFERITFDEMISSSDRQLIKNDEQPNQIYNQQQQINNEIVSNIHQMNPQIQEFKQVPKKQVHFGNEQDETEKLIMLRQRQRQAKRLLNQMSFQ